MALATKLSYKEFMMLVGLSYVARDTDKMMLTCVRGVAKITGEVLDQNDYGHAADMIYSPEGNNAVEDVRIMVHQMGIVDEEEKPDDEVPEAS